jgi:hypothetical protein
MDYLDGLTWRTSSYSGSNGGNCIEIATAAGIVAVRDSNDSPGPVLVFGARIWQQFADRVKADG